jgi:uncharacterized protein (DUF362 family)
MNIDRREFMRRMVALGFTVATASTLFSWLSCSNRDTAVPEPPATPSSPASSTPPTAAPSSGTLPGTAYMAVARGESPAEMVKASVNALGGIERFIKPGNDVIIKPNICVAHRTFEYAATTNPEVVGTLTALCIGAGAKQVRVMDFPFGGTAEAAYIHSGIAEKVTAAGGKMENMADYKYREAEIPDGQDLKKWEIYGDALDADVLINVPIAKHHSLARLTLGMKNLMGLIQNRNQLHSNLGQRIADITSVLRPELTVIDAVRILTNHGPQGGSPDDVKVTNTVIASHDVVAADAFAATLFGLNGADIPATRAGAQMGLGTMDLNTIKIEEIAV